MDNVLKLMQKMRKKRDILFLDLKSSYNNIFVVVINQKGFIIRKHSLGMLKKNQTIRISKPNYQAFVIGIKIGKNLDKSIISIRVHGVLLFRTLPFLKGFFKANSSVLFLEIKNKQTFNGCRPRKLKRLLFYLWK